MGRLGIGGVMVVMVWGCFGFSLAPASAGDFHPQDLSPDFLVESVATFTNPLGNAQCTGVERPNYCCTGPGTGICDRPVASFRLVTCTSRNIDCDGVGSPFPCCTGPGTGNCCYEQADTAAGGLGNAYCSPVDCPDGCVRQWVDQSGYRSDVSTHPITGRTLEQDDLEKACYVEDCLNGHGCVQGGPAWSMPDYPPAQRPKQDATLELEPADRTGALASCVGPFYLAQLVRIDHQLRDHRLLAGFTKRIVAQNAFQFRAFSGATTVSVDDVFPKDGAWYFIELQRNNDNTLQVWIDGVDRTRAPAATQSTSAVFGTNLFCDTKSCDLLDNQEFQGAGALLFFRCGTAPISAEKELFRAYVGRIYTDAVFDDGFETGTVERWNVTGEVLLFADGFESGNTSIWALSTP